jgi:hypothetical protein
MIKIINIDFKHESKLGKKELFIHKSIKILNIEQLSYYCDKYINEINIYKYLSIDLIRIINEYVEINYEKIFEKIKNTIIFIWESANDHTKCQCILINRKKLAKNISEITIFNDKNIEKDVINDILSNNDTYKLCIKGSLSPCYYTNLYVKPIYKKIVEPIEEEDMVIHNFDKIIDQNNKTCNNKSIIFHKIIIKISENSYYCLHCSVCFINNYEYSLIEYLNKNINLNEEYINIKANYKKIY